MHKITHDGDSAANTGWRLLEGNTFRAPAGGRRRIITLEQNHIDDTKTSLYITFRSIKILSSFWCMSRSKMKQFLHKKLATLKMLMLGVEV